MLEQFQKDLTDTIARTQKFIDDNIKSKADFLKDYEQKNGKLPNKDLMERVEAKFSINKAQKVLDFLPQQTYIDPNLFELDKLEELVFETQKKFFELGQTKSFMLLYKDALMTVLKNPNISFEKYTKEIFQLATNDEFAAIVAEIILNKKAPLERVLSDIISERYYFLYKHLFQYFELKFFDELIMRAIINDEKFFFTTIDLEFFDFKYLDLFVKSAVKFGDVKRLDSLNKFEFDYSENDNEILDLAVERGDEDIVNKILHKQDVMDSISIYKIQQLPIKHEIKNHIISKKNLDTF